MTDRGPMTSEYESLRQEMNENKRMVFERPLLLLGGASAVAAMFGEAPAAAFLPTILLLLLWFNLSMTNNRLRSNSRIVAYLELVHEARSHLSKGWEWALSAYRRELAAGELSEMDPATWEPMDRAADDESMRFYDDLYRFHVWLGMAIALLITVGTMGSAWFREGTVFRFEPGLTLVAVAVNLVGLPVYYLHARRFQPRTAAHGIEAQRRAWKAILQPAP